MLKEHPTERVQVTEPTIIPDVFITGMLPIETGDGWYRMTFYVEKQEPPGSGICEQQIVARLVMTKEFFLETVRTARATMPILKTLDS